ncbi:hypothetical protein ACX9MO_11915 [Pseudooceanicola sp. 502str34]
MCALCGILGCDDHWTAAVAREGVYSRLTSPQAHRAEAAARARVVNRALAPLRITFGDWQKRSYVLRGPTGKTAIFEGLNHLWAEAETLAGREIDPLDPAYLDRLEG